MRAIKVSLVLLGMLFLGACAGTTNRVLDSVGRVDGALDSLLGGMVVRSNTTISNSATKTFHRHNGEDYHRDTCTDEYSYNRDQSQSYNSETGDREVSRSSNRTISKSCWGKDIYPRTS